MLALRFKFPHLNLHAIERIRHGWVGGAAAAMEQKSEERAHRQRQNNSG